MIHKAYRYRIYPNKAQQAMMTKTFGCVRFVYNYFLAMRKQEWDAEHLTVGYARCSKELTALKADEDLPGMWCCPSPRPQCSPEYFDGRNTDSGNSVCMIIS